MFKIIDKIVFYGAFPFLAIIIGFIAFLDCGRYGYNWEKYKANFWEIYGGQYGKQ